MGFLNNPITALKFREFKKALNSVDTDKIAELLEGWGKRYFKDSWKEYMNEVRGFLADIVKKMGGKIK